ncbi:MAG: hypothetical protein ACREQ5_39745 [Candidatus Dormibacteria bacterium]
MPSEGSVQPRPRPGRAEPASTLVERRLEDLRARTAQDATTAAEEVWSWLLELSRRAADDRHGADRELNELFRLGTPPMGLDGPTDGILVATTITPLLDRVVRVITGRWMPWQGKRFNAAGSVGDNRMVNSARFPAKLLWPLYSMTTAQDGNLAFDFDTYVEEGRQDPDRRVLVIDYSRVAGNPRLIIRSIRDELVELVPGACLGKILFRLRSGGYTNLGYFALRV